MYFKSGGRYPAASKLILQIATESNLQQLVDKPTRLYSILDLCSSTNASLVHDIQVKADVSDHDIVVANVNVVPHRNKCPRRKIFLYHKGDFDKISEQIKDFNSSLKADKIASCTIEELWSDFKNVTLDAMDSISHIPSKLSSTGHNLPWVYRSIKRAINNSVFTT